MKKKFISATLTGMPPMLAVPAIAASFSPVSACAAAGVRELTLEVRVSNDAAQALYRAYGFRLAGLRPGYYRYPEEDALLMTRPIPPGPPA